MTIEVPERASENLRKQLSVAVRSVQWSYAIFWSLSTTQQGVLEWCDGYYNGDIKTRRTVPAAEVYADKLGLRRSEQLRELYESLLEGESELGNSRPAAVLSPEDLSDLEWYYLVCMSFTFKVGESLPGKTFASGQSIWLCNAQNADSKLFSRSLLAKSASVKTVICFPHMGGAIELGVTDMVTEDPNLIQHVKTSLLEFAKPVCAEKSSSDRENIDYDNGQIGARIPVINQEMVDELERSMSMEFDMGSPDECSNELCRNNQQREDSTFEGDGNGIVADSPVQSCYLGDDDDEDDDDDDDDLSRYIQESFNSSGCISQAFVSPKQPNSFVVGRNTNNRIHLREIQDGNNTKFSSLDLGTNNDDEDLHYKRTLAVILQTSSNVVSGQSLCSSSQRSSSFNLWRKAYGVSHPAPQLPQSTLKKILFAVPSIIARSPLEPPNGDGKQACPYKPLADKKSIQHGLSETTRENEKYSVLKSLVPSTNKVDKTSILNDTIEYLKELEARVEELESCINQSEYEAKARRKNVDVVEQTSDNYHNKSRSDPKKMLVNKRKACDIDENEAEPQLGKPIPFGNNMPVDVNVTIREQEVLIEMRCPWREYLLIDVMDAVNSLSLDAHTVQSSTEDGILNLSLKSKFRGAAFASAGMIKQALRKMVGIC